MNFKMIFFFLLLTSCGGNKGSTRYREVPVEVPSQCPAPDLYPPTSPPEEGDDDVVICRLHKDLEKIRESESLVSPEECDGDEESEIKSFFTKKDCQLYLHTYVSNLMLSKQAEGSTSFYEDDEQFKRILLENAAKYKEWSDVNLELYEACMKEKKEFKK